MLPPAPVEDDGADVAPAHVQEKVADSVVHTCSVEADAVATSDVAPKNRSTPPRSTMPIDMGEANAALEHDSNGPTTQSEKQRSGNESVLAAEPLETVVDEAAAAAALPLNVFTQCASLSKPLQGSGEAVCAAGTDSVFCSLGKNFCWPPR